MKRYENPIMSVSLFDVENIVVASNPEVTAVQEMEAMAANLKKDDNNIQVVRFTF